MMSEPKQIKAYQRGNVILDASLVEDIRSWAMGNVYIAEHKKWKIKVAIKAPNKRFFRVCNSDSSKKKQNLPATRVLP